MARPDDRTERPLAVAIAGCGAATRLYAAPALARLGARRVLSVSAIFDPDPAAAAAVRAILPGAAVAESFSSLLERADILLIASPPSAHAEQALAALEAGLHVFCEKPMAIASSDADRMVASAQRHERLLTVNFIRRQLPATRAIKALLEAESIGPLRSVEWFEGGPFDWPVASPDYFTRAQSGGGVLQDIGTHAFDLLTWWYGTPELLSYTDDAMGGVEANAEILLRCAEAEVRMRLSRDWARPNRVAMTGACGAIEWPVNDPLTFTLDLPGTQGPCQVTAADAAGEEPDYIWAYGAQVESFVEAIRSGRPPAVEASEGRDACALVESCYRSRHKIEMPWLNPHPSLKSASFEAPR